MTLRPLPTDKDLYKRLAIRLALAVALGLFLIYLLPQLINLTLPFIFALFVAVILNPFIRRINRKLLPNRSLTTLIITLFFVIALISFTFLIVYRLIREAISLTVFLQSNWQDILLRLDEFVASFDWIAERLPEQAWSVIMNFRANVISFIQDGVMGILTSAVSVGASFVSGVGNVMIGLLTFFLAMYFLMADYEPLRRFTHKVIGGRGMSSFAILKNSIFRTFGGYLRAQMIFALIAFVLMFTALTIYQQPYALLLALLLAFVDLLPIVGTIAILGPWGAFELVTGDVQKGIFLIALGVGYFMVRRVLEPKIMGSQTGLHPLLTLISVYVGLRFSGIWGALLGPVVMVLIISILQSGMLDGTVADVRAAMIHMSLFLSRSRGVRDEPDVVVRHSASGKGIAEQEE